MAVQCRAVGCSSTCVSEPTHQRTVEAQECVLSAAKVHLSGFSSGFGDSAQMARCRSAVGRLFVLRKHCTS